MGNFCCSRDLRPKRPSASEKEDFIYKLAPPSKIKEAYDTTIDYKKTVVEAPDFISKLRKLNSTGKIVMEEGTNFWYIKLDKKWQDLQDNLRVTLSNGSAYQRTEFVKQCTDQVSKWAALLGLVAHQDGWFTPLSKAGIHITLGVFKPDDKPDVIYEGKKVSFTIKNLVSVPNTDALPILYPGQRTFQKGNNILIHCPTRWWYVEVDVKDFDFDFKHSSHVSLACYGLINVPLKALKELHESLKLSGCKDNSEYCNNDN